MANDVVKQLFLLFLVVKVLPNPQLQWVVPVELQLRALLIPVTLTEDHAVINLEVLVPCPSARTDVILEPIPATSVICAVKRHCLTIDLVARVAPLSTDVDEPVALKRVHVQDWNTHPVGGEGQREWGPQFARVGRDVHFVLSEEISAIMGEGVEVYGEELDVFCRLVPGVTLVEGLPDLPIVEVNKDSLRYRVRHGFT